MADKDSKELYTREEVLEQILSAEHRQHPREATDGEKINASLTSLAKKSDVDCALFVSAGVNALLPICNLCAKSRQSSTAILANSTINAVSVFQSEARL